MRAAIDPSIEHIVVRAADNERVRSDTAAVVERDDGSLLVAYHSYSHGPEGGGDFGAAKVYLTESEDGGRHWTNDRLVADIVPGGLNVSHESIPLPGYCSDYSNNEFPQFIPFPLDILEPTG